jgi:hypothetical protein
MFWLKKIRTRAPCRVVCHLASLVRRWSSHYSSKEICAVCTSERRVALAVPPEIEISLLQSNLCRSFQDLKLCTIMRRTCPDIHEFYPNFRSPVAPPIEDLAILALDAISFTDHPWSLFYLPTTVCSGLAGRCLCSEF